MSNTELKRMFQQKYPTFEIKYIEITERAEIDLQQATLGSKKHLLRLSGYLEICEANLHLLNKEIEDDSYDLSTYGEIVEEVLSRLNNLISGLRKHINSNNYILQDIVDDFHAKYNSGETIVLPSSQAVEELIVQKKRIDRLFEMLTK